MNPKLKEIYEKCEAEAERYALAQKRSTTTGVWLHAAHAEGARYAIPLVRAATIREVIGYLSSVHTGENYRLKPKDVAQVLLMQFNEELEKAK